MQKLEEQLVIRVAKPLRDELESAAREDARPLASYVRRLLIEHATARVTERAEAGMV
jgi:hypothetical protein